MDTPPRTQRTVFASKTENAKLQAPSYPDVVALKRNSILKLTVTLVAIFAACGVLQVNGGPKTAESDAKDTTLGTNIANPKTFQYQEKLLFNVKAEQVDNFLHKAFDPSVWVKRGGHKIGAGQTMGWYLIKENGGEIFWIDRRKDVQQVYINEKLVSTNYRDLYTGISTTNLNGQTTFESWPNILYSQDRMHILVYGQRYDKRWGVVFNNIEQPETYGKIKFCGFTANGGYYIVAKESNGYSFYIDGKKQGRSYTGIESKPVTATYGGKLRYSFIAKEDRKNVLILDGDKIDAYEDVAPVRFSCNEGAYAYAGKKGAQWFVVRDGKEQEKAYADEPKVILYSEKAGRFVVGEATGDRAFATSKFRYVIDGNPEPQFDAMDDVQFWGNNDENAYYTAYIHDKNKIYQVLMVNGSEVARAQTFIVSSESFLEKSVNGQLPGLEGLFNAGFDKLFGTSSLPKGTRELGSYEELPYFKTISTIVRNGELSYIIKRYNPAKKAFDYEKLGLLPQNVIVRSIVGRCEDTGEHAILGYKKDDRLAYYNGGIEKWSVDLDKWGISSNGQRLLIERNSNEYWRNSTVWGTSYEEVVLKPKALQLNPIVASRDFEKAMCTLVHYKMGIKPIIKPYYAILDQGIITELKEWETVGDCAVSDGGNLRVAMVNGKDEDCLLINSIRTKGFDALLLGSLKILGETSVQFTAVEGTAVKTVTVEVKNKQEGIALGSEP